MSLARALYSSNDIFLMDDPLAALDANVKKKIFVNLIMKKLKNSTRVLITHSIDFLHLADRILIMKDGEMV